MDFPTARLESLSQTEKRIFNRVRFFLCEYLFKPLHLCYKELAGSKLSPLVAGSTNQPLPIFGEFRRMGTGEKMDIRQIPGVGTLDLEPLPQYSSLELQSAVIGYKFISGGHEAVMSFRLKLLPEVIDHCLLAQRKEYGEISPFGISLSARKVPGFFSNVTPAESCLPLWLITAMQGLARELKLKKLRYDSRASALPPGTITLVMVHSENIAEPLNYILERIIPVFTALTRHVTPRHKRISPEELEKLTVLVAGTPLKLLPWPVVGKGPGITYHEVCGRGSEWYYLASNIERWLQFMPDLAVVIVGDHEGAGLDVARLIPKDLLNMTLVWFDEEIPSDVKAEYQKLGINHFATSHDIHTAIQQMLEP